MAPKPYDPFNVSAILPDFEAQFAEMQSASDTVRAAHRAMLDLRYGPGPRQRLDLFFPPGDATDRPIHMFIHGGYWRGQVKEDYAFVAEGAIAAGAIAAIVEYTLLPAVRHDRQVADIRDAARWLATHARDFGGDGRQLSASGHSAGGHLVTYLAARAPNEGSDPAPVVSSVIALSGIFDLSPIVTSYLQPELHLTDAEVAEWSPLRGSPAEGVHFDIAVGGLETTPFHAQAAAYLAMLRAKGIDAEVTTRDGLDHMSLCRELGRPGRPMADKIAEVVARSGG